ncbi:MAG: GFA family protein [Pseudomonadota bacterium]
MTIPGSCCCGAVRFELAAPPSMMGTCHCSRCRKVGASSFVFVARDAFTLLSGADNIATYAPEPGYRYARSFCSKCGTALGEIGSDAPSFPVPANTLDADPGVRNRFHEFTAEKPGWYEIADDAKQFPGHPVKADPQDG